jgi:large subunit ribosomal protein L23
MKSVTISRERVFEVIRMPQVSEKATFIADKHNQIIFRVSSDANKMEIKSAIEQLWKAQNIQVKSVQISNVKGKKKRFGRYLGRRAGWKKAYVSLKGNQEIDFTDVKLFEDK